MQIQWKEQKQITEVLDGETGQGEADLFRGRIEHILDNAARNAGLATTQSKCWKKEEEGIDARVLTRGRIKSERIKESGGAGKYYQERWAERDSRQRRTEEARERKKSREGKQMETWQKDQKEEKDLQERERQREQETKAQGRKKHRMNRIRKTAEDKKNRIGKR